MCLTSLVCFSFVLEGVLVRVYCTGVLESCVCCWGNKHLVATPCGNWDLIFNYVKKTTKGNFEGQLCLLGKSSFKSHPSLPSFQLKSRGRGTEGRRGTVMVWENANGGRCEHGVTSGGKKGKSVKVVKNLLRVGTPRSSSKAQSKRVRRQESGKKAKRQVPRVPWEGRRWTRVQRLLAVAESHFLYSPCVLC